MKNFVAHGDTVTVIAPGDLSSGDIFAVNELIGVAVRDALTGEEVAMKRVGVFDLSVKAINDNGNSAVQPGDKIYYVSADTPKLSKKTSGLFVGYAIEGVSSSQTATIKVLLPGAPGPGTLNITPQSVTTAELADNAVTTTKIASKAVKTASIDDEAVDTAQIADGAVTSAKLANGAGVAALLAAGLGASDSYDKATAGEQELLAADSVARVALVMAVVDEAFADGDGAQSVFAIGEEDDPDLFTDGTAFIGAQAGDVFFFAAPVTATKALTVTGTAATGTGTGGISVTALVLPAASP